MENPNYYGILPANVRYDRNLKAMEKILYTELTALANKKGYCNAKNSYFAKLYEVHKNTAGAWINNLEKLGYIKSELIYAIDKNGITTKQVIERKIYINNLMPINEKIDTYQEKKLEGVNEKIDTPINQNIEVNNTSNEYYKNNNKDSLEKESIDIVVNAWNELAESYDLGKIRNCRGKRAINLKARLKQEGVEKIKEAFENIKNSLFLQGKVDKFKITFDWLLVPGNFDKILENKYSDKKTKMKKEYKPISERNLNMEEWDL